MKGEGGERAVRPRPGGPTLAGAALGHSSCHRTVGPASQALGAEAGEDEVGQGAPWLGGRRGHWGQGFSSRLPGGVSLPKPAY